MVWPVVTKLAEVALEYPYCAPDALYLLAISARTEGLCKVPARLHRNDACSERV